MNGKLLCNAHVLTKMPALVVSTNDGQTATYVPLKATNHSTRAESTVPSVKFAIWTMPANQLVLTDQSIFLSLYPDITRLTSYQDAMALEGVSHSL